MTCPNRITPRETNYLSFNINITDSVMTETLEEPTTNAVTESQDTKNQIVNLRLALEKDIVACDIKWSLFVAAAQSYRYHSRLNPYPPKYATKEKSEYDIDRIRLTISNVPPLHQLLRQMVNEEMRLSEEIVDLVHWVVCSKSFSTLRNVAKGEVSMRSGCNVALKLFSVTSYNFGSISVRFNVEKGRFYNAGVSANTRFRSCIATQ